MRSLEKRPLVPAAAPVHRAPAHLEGGHLDRSYGQRGEDDGRAEVHPGPGAAEPGDGQDPDLPTGEPKQEGGRQMRGRHPAAAWQHP